MAKVKLRIGIGGTVGDEAWRRINHFGEILGAAYGPEFGGSGPCIHPPEMPHHKGEWRGAVIRVETALLAQYAVSHYLEQDRVLDADVED